MVYGVSGSWDLSWIFIIFHCRDIPPGVGFSLHRKINFAYFYRWKSCKGKFPQAFVIASLRDKRCCTQSNKDTWGKRKNEKLVGQKNRAGKAGIFFILKTPACHFLDHRRETFVEAISIYRKNASNSALKIMLWEKNGEVIQLTWLHGQKASTKN